MRPNWSLSSLLADLTERGWFRWTVALAVVAIGTIVLATAKAILHRRLARLAPQTQNKLDDIAADLVSRTSTIFLVALSTLAATAITDLTPKVEKVAHALALMVCLIQAGVWGARALNEAVERRFAAAPGNGGGDDPTRQTVARMLGLGARVGLWVLVLLVALDNLGVDITALVAGLGVGGVAVALATQNILGDLFASVSILLDKPFVPGDFVIVGDFMGTVEQVGIKTTRVRSLGGEQIVFANNDLLQSRLRNYKRMSERRVVFRIGVVYQTAVEKLVAIPEIVRTIIENQGGTRFDRAHFAAYGDFALTFEVVYYVLSPDYNRYMDLQQAINLDIYRAFQSHCIEFAYPTQTLLLQPPSGQRVSALSAGEEVAHE
jgi:small-conductance mechanosensitive channel